MRQVLTIPGRLPGLNEYTDACRSNAYAGGKMKRQYQNLVCQVIRLSRLKPVSGRVDITYEWYEKPPKRGRMRDKDNIRFAAKFINDALVEVGIIKDDDWKNIGELSDRYFRASKDPRIVVIIEEQDA